MQTAQQQVTTTLPPMHRRLRLTWSHIGGIAGLVIVLFLPFMVDRPSTLSILAAELRAGTRALQQYQRITDPTSANDGDQFGYALALDNNTLIVGAPSKNNGVGSVSAYIWNGGNWELQQELLPNDPQQNASFGWSVDLAGNTAIIGAPDINAAYIFTRSGSIWTQAQKLTGPGSSFFGYGVGIDGSSTLTAIIGAYGENNLTGAVYAYTGSGTNWTLQQRFIADDASESSCFGAVVSLDDQTVAIGAVTKDCTDFTPVYIFTRNVSTWSQQAKLEPSDNPTQNSFGLAIALRSNTVIIGAPGQVSDDDPEMIIGGAAYVFTRNVNTWSQQAKLVSSDISGSDDFGRGVAISADSNTVLIGAINHNNEWGAAYFFTRSVSTWTQGQKLVIANTVNGVKYGLGNAAAINTNLAIVGAAAENGGTGAVYHYLEASLIPTPTNTLTPSQTPTNTPTNTPTQTFTPSQTPTNTATFTPSATPSATHTASLTPIGTLPTATPTQTPTLTPTPTPTDLPGVDVIVNGDFETDSEPDGIPDGWTITNPTGDKIKCNTETKQFAFTGNCAFRFKSRAGENSRIRHNVDLMTYPIAQGDTLLLSGAVFPKGIVNTSVKVRVIYADTNLPRGKINAKFTAATTGYVTFTGNAPLVLAGVPAEIRVLLGNKGTAGSVLYDAISLNWTLPESRLIPLP